MVWYGMVYFVAQDKIRFYTIFLSTGGGLLILEKKILKVLSCTGPFQFRQKIFWGKSRFFFQPKTTKFKGSHGETPCETPCETLWGTRWETRCGTP